MHLPLLPAIIMIMLKLASADVVFQEIRIAVKEAFSHSLVWANDYFGNSNEIITCVQKK